MNGCLKRWKLVIFTTILPLITLVGCDWGKSGTELCNNNPELCADLHRDGWCWKEKNDLIDKRYASKTQTFGNGKYLYREMLSLEAYGRCIEISTTVRHVIGKSRRHDRAKAFTSSFHALSKLQQQTKNSDALFLAFYHWTKLRNMRARTKVLGAIENGTVDDAELLGAVATYYEKFNLHKSKEIYFDALIKSDEDTVEPDWLLGIARSAKASGAYREAYVLIRANVLLTEHTADEEAMDRLLHGQTHDIDELEHMASELADDIEDGDYKRSKLRSKLENF